MLIGIPPCSAPSFWRRCAPWAMATRSPSSTATIRPQEQARRADPRRRPRPDRGARCGARGAAGRRLRAAGAVSRLGQGRSRRCRSGPSGDRWRSAPAARPACGGAARRPELLRPGQGGACRRCNQRAAPLRQCHRPQGRDLSERRAANHDRLLRRSPDRHAAARRRRAGEPAFAPYAGGAVFNTAIALGRLGVPVGFFSGLSSDLFGDSCATRWRPARSARPTRTLSPRPTTLAFVRLVDGQATYLFYDENTAGRMLSMRRPAGTRRRGRGHAVRRHQPDPGALRHRPTRR